MKIVEIKFKTSTDKGIIYLWTFFYCLDGIIILRAIVRDMSKICEMFLKLNLYLIKYGTILKIITC